MILQFCNGGEFGFDGVIGSLNGVPCYP